jgi:hypothetical protein
MAQMSPRLRWLLTIPAFPLAGLAALAVAGEIDGPGRAALGGLVAGAVLGAAQVLALRTGAAWALRSAAGLAAGSALGALLTGAGTSGAELAVYGAAGGLGLGLAQASLSRDRLWPLLVAGALALGWVTTWGVGVDVERGYAVPGLGGATVFVLLTLVRRPAVER